MRSFGRGGWLEINMPDSRAFGSAVGTWLRAQRAGIALVGAVILGQLTRVLFETLQHAQFLTTGRPPLLGVLGLVVALAWCAVIIWARLRVGQELNNWARAWFSGFAVSEAIPRRYVIEDRGALLAAALCAVVDLVLLLVLQNTVRAPLLLVLDSYISPAWADAAFVVLVVIVALVVLSRMYRTSKPVSAYLAWSVMDRLVPTAGFLAGPAPALAGGRTGSRTAPAVDPDQTAVSERRAAPEQRSATPGLAEEVTVRAPSVDPEQTAVSEKTVVADKQVDAERTVVAEKHPDVKGDQR
jgi:hypothetical protein